MGEGEWREGGREGGRGRQGDRGREREGVVVGRGGGGGGGGGGGKTHQPLTRVDDLLRVREAD